MSKNKTNEPLISLINNSIVRDKIINSSDRIRRVFDVQFSGYDLVAEDILNETLRVAEYSGIVSVQKINFYTYCEHHFTPFFGQADVFYEPNEIITGLGKIVRLVHDLHARKLQIQEIMTQDIAKDIMRVLGAKGCFVRTNAKHLCVCSRGPSDDTSITTVVYGLGSLKNYSPI